MKQIKHLFTGKRDVFLFSSCAECAFPLQEGLEGSELTYHCGPGKYPFPVSHRLCADGEWSPMRLVSGRQVSQATCKGNASDGESFNFGNQCKFLSSSSIVLSVHPSPPCSLPCGQTCCVQLSSSWIMETFGQGTSGSVLG